MLEFKKREIVFRLEAEDDGILVNCVENRKWDRKTRKHSQETDWRVTAEFLDDSNYSSVDLCVASEEEARAIAADAVAFLKSIRPVVLIQKEDEKDSIQN